ncbi:hypothetical protein ILYODFUR_037575 [Ilyodon furcidens]|uniref:Uncharacterized protein n=1 Tax=Ilyodon furcidens TaxID=33524 RepID=A0ABV0UFR8_9TELE
MKVKKKEMIVDFRRSRNMPKTDSVMGKEVGVVPLCSQTGQEEKENNLCTEGDWADCTSLGLKKAEQSDKEGWLCCWDSSGLSIDCAKMMVNKIKAIMVNPASSA